jgi:hypothetical protein
MSLSYGFRVALITGILVVVAVADIHAAPTFARRYETSCATCHQAFPRLNGVGESFRLSGYRFVDDTRYRKVEPVEMGDEAYKRLWPNALWPSDVPRRSPLAFISRMMIEADLDGSRPSTMTYLLPEEAELVWVGNLGEGLLFYGDIIFLQKDFGGSDPASWATLKAWLQFQSVLGPDNRFNVRIGSVGTQSMFLFTARDSNFYGTHFYQYTSWFMPKVKLEDAGLASFDGNNFSHAPAAGIEINGIGRRWSYAFGIVNGNSETSPADIPKSDVSFWGMGRNKGTHDAFLQLAWKFGGLPFDRSLEEPESSLTTGAEFWRDDSLTVSLFGYTGTAEISSVDLEGNSWVGDDDFWRLGAGALKQVKDLSLSVAYVAGNNENPYGNLSDRAVESTAWHVEALGFVYPWLMPYTRYEVLELDMPTGVPGIGSERDIERVVGGAKMMIRPNVSVTAEYAHYFEGAELEEGFDQTLFLLFGASF